MNEERNIKTLIICFVLSLMALVPLRFVEINNMRSSSVNPKVLGDESVIEVLKEKVLEEKKEKEEVNRVEEGIVLPDIDIEQLVEVSY